MVGSYVEPLGIKVSGRRVSMRTVTSPEDAENVLDVLRRWTPEQDEIIIWLQAQMHSWRHIALLLRGKRHMVGEVRPQFKRLELEQMVLSEDPSAPWTMKEDKQLVEFYN